MSRTVFGRAVAKAVVALPRRTVDRIAEFAVKKLTEPIKSFEPSDVTNLRSLKTRLELGDVLLVCGNARISYIVKVLTTSAWSHVVLYCGDRRDLMRPEDIEYWTARHGQASLEHLVLDADPVRGVHLRPIEEFVGQRIRHCRATALTEEDRNKVLDMAMSQLGKDYDTTHIVKLLFYLAFPWGLFPKSIHGIFTSFALTDSDTICSRVVAEAFDSVGYPIRPTEIVETQTPLEKHALGIAVGFARRRRSAARLLRAGKVRDAFTRLTDKRLAEVHLRQGRHVVPGDYDLSRFFDIIKDPGDLLIGYQGAKAFYSLDEE